MHCILEIVLIDLADGLVARGREEPRTIPKCMVLARGEQLLLPFAPLVKTGEQRMEMRAGNMSSVVDILSIKSLSDIQAEILCRPLEREL